MAAARGEVRLGKDGELIIPPLTTEDVPAEAEALRDEPAAMLPRVPIASVLVEIDARTGFTDLLTHAGGMATRRRTCGATCCQAGGFRSSGPRFEPSRPRRVPPAPS
ncbi:MAG TPA: hypothetical protein VFV73_19095 [Streptosporangiaceae bacterium]|nr:hypothetical protein [Streptosporangiaceae bacterium]